MKRFLTVICLLTAIGISCNGWAASHISIGDLKCENLKSPLAIDNTSPHFSWKMYSKKMEHPHRLTRLSLQAR
jgi:hypothetical protein